MKAIVYTEYGPPEVLQLKEVEKPAPKDNEIRIRVHAASVNYGDILARNFRGISPQKFNMPLPLWVITKLLFGVRKPKTTTLGSEFAGEVEAAGKAVKRFKAGDPVFGYTGQSMGAYAEYLCMPENGAVAIKPAVMSDQEAAVVPYGAIMALSLLRKQDIRPGHKVLVNGASGGIGSAAVQLARHDGAEVTGVCGAPGLDYVKSLGADKAVDYSKEDFTGSGETYDLIFDILGKSSFSRCRNSLAPNGRYLRASFKTRELWQMLWTAMKGGKRVICALAPGSLEDLLFVRELIEAGKLRSVIDRTYPLERIVEAHRYVDQGHKKGNVVITVGHAMKA